MHHKDEGSMYWYLTQEELEKQIALMQEFIATLAPGDELYDGAARLLPHARQALAERDFSLDRRWFALMKGGTGWIFHDSDEDSRILLDRVKAGEENEGRRWQEVQFDFVWLTEDELRRVMKFDDETIHHGKIQIDISGDAE